MRNEEMTIFHLAAREAADGEFRAAVAPRGARQEFLFWADEAKEGGRA